MYKLNAKSQDILANTTLMPQNFGGWIAVNTGTATAIVDGYELAPGEGLDFTNIPAEVVWNTPIQIVLASGAKVRITRFLYSEVQTRK